jgi:hypothetical protein
MAIFFGEGKFSPIFKLDSIRARGSLLTQQFLDTVVLWWRFFEKNDLKCHFRKYYGTFAH